MNKDTTQQFDGPRALRPEEQPAAMRLINLLFRPDNPGSMEKEFPHIFGETNMENMRVILNGNEVISHTAIVNSTLKSGDLSFKIGGISAVGTHPDYRGKGLASEVMRDCIDVMREQGCHISFLWTDLHGFYQNLGYEPSGSFCLFKPPPSILSGASQDCEVVPYSPERLPEIIQIHDREFIRTERTAQEYETYFSTPKSITLMALRDGRVTAYAVMGMGRDLQGFIHDWGGEPRDLLHLARELTALSETGEIYFLAPAHENRLTSHLMDMDVPSVFMNLVMLKVIDVDGVSSIVSDYVSGRMGREFQIAQDSTGVKIKVGREEAYIEPARILASVLFGPEPPSSYLKDFPQEMLSALDKALPIPFFIWGLDWV